MHYYQHHIGDFIKATSRLSDAHCMTYLRMIWLYYEQECPLPDNTAVIGLKVGAEPEVVSLILNAFFKRDGDVWRHTRCDTEIAEYQAICERNRTNGKAGGRPKKTQSVSTGMPDETPPEPHRNPNHKPVTIKEEANASVASGDRLPPCNLQSIVDLYHRVLPELPAVRLLNDQRRKAAKSFWTWVLTSKKSDGTCRANTAEEALDWIEAYFDRARDNDFLMGRTERSGKHGGWVCDFDFLLTEKGKKHVIEKTGVAA